MISNLIPDVLPANRSHLWPDPSYHNSEMRCLPGFHHQEGDLLLISRDSLIWFTGNIPHMSITLENETIVHATFAKFDNGSLGGDLALVVISTLIRIYFIDGTHYVANISFIPSKVWALESGIFIERLHDDDDIPILFSLSHPLEEAKPIFVNEDISLGRSFHLSDQEEILDSSINVSGFGDNYSPLTRESGVISAMFIDNRSSGMLITHSRSKGQICLWEYNCISDDDSEDEPINDSSFNPSSPRASTLSRDSPLSIRRDRNFRSSFEVIKLWSLDKDNEKYSFSN